MEYTASKQTEQCASLRQMLNEHKFCDITFIVGENKAEYNVNRIFLSLISPVFEAMLFGQMQESKPNSDVIIDDIKAEIFECILNFAYCNDPNITSTNVIYMIRAADKYQIKTLLNWCKEYLISCLNQTNFCTLFNQAVVLNQINAMQICHQFIRNDSVDMMQLIQSDGWKQLGMKTMQSLLKSNHLRVKEDELWTNVVKWAEYHQTIKSIKSSDCIGNEELKYDDDDTGVGESHCTKTELLKEIRNLIRFGLMDGRYFATKVVPLHILSKDELINILLFFQYPEAGCAFNTEKRTGASSQLLEYTLQMSSKHSLANNTYEGLIDSDLSLNCGTEAVENERSFIVAKFAKEMSIENIEIGAPSLPRYKRHQGTKFLNESKLKLYDGEMKMWIVSQCLSLFKPGEIRTLDIKYTNSKITKIAIVASQKKTHLGIGCLRIYGREADD